MRCMIERRMGEGIRAAAPVSTRGSTDTYVTPGLPWETAAEDQRPGGHEGALLLVVGVTRFAIFALERGFLRNRPGAVFVDVPLADVEFVARESGLAGGLLPRVLVGLADGRTFDLEVGRLSARRVDAVRRAIVDSGSESVVGAE